MEKLKKEGQMSRYRMSIKQNYIKFKRKVKSNTVLNKVLKPIFKYIRKSMLILQLIYLRKNRKRDTIKALARGMEIDFEKAREEVNKLDQEKIKIAFLITEYDEIYHTGDKYSAISLGEALRKKNEKIVISYYVQHPRIEWGNIDKNTDYVISMDPSVNIKFLSAIKGKKIAWVRGNQERWFIEGSIQQYDGIMVSSNVLERFFINKGLQHKLIGVIPLGIPIDVQRAISGDNIEWIKRENDVIFIGNIYEVERDIVRNLILDNTFDFKFYGNIHVEKHKWDKFNQGPIDHNEITNIYKASKIVIEDIAPINRGTVNLRVFEASASGAFVIANYDEALVELFGSSIEMYKTKEELNEKIKYYLTHEYERVKKAKQLNALIWNQYTFDKQAEGLLNKWQKK